MFKSTINEWQTASSKRKINKVQPEIIVENYKKTLCKNIGIFGSCIYGSKCKYAHSLEEQNIEPLRKQIYDLLKNDTDLSNINLFEEKNIYMEFLLLTKLCYLCNDNKCSGGYNCKNGSYDKKFIICISDLNTGKCNTKVCCKIHLTSRGLIPYDVVFNRSIRISHIPKKEVINEEFFSGDENTNIEIELKKNKLTTSIFRM